jgi:hypothetical protein
MGKQEGKRPIGRPKLKWEVKIDYNGNSMDLIRLNLDKRKVMGFCEHGMYHRVL